AAQRQDAGAGPAEISQQKLEQRAAPDDLRAVGMLRPCHGVSERRRSVGAGAGQNGVRHFQKRVSRTARRPLDHLRRVAAEMLLDDLKNAAWILQRVVTLRRWLQQRLD